MVSSLASLSRHAPVSAHRRTVTKSHDVAAARPIREARRGRGALRVAAIGPGERFFDRVTKNKRCVFRALVHSLTRINCSFDCDFRDQATALQQFATGGGPQKREQKVESERALASLATRFFFFALFLSLSFSTCTPVSLSSSSFFLADHQKRDKQKTSCTSR